MGAWQVCKRVVISWTTVVVVRTVPFPGHLRQLILLISKARPAVDSLISMRMHDHDAELLRTSTNTTRRPPEAQLPTPRSTYAFSCAIHDRTALESSCATRNTAPSVA
jgi:hypothetical protein